MDRILDIILHPVAGRVCFGFGVVFLSKGYTESGLGSFILSGVGGLLLGYGAACGWKD